MDRFPKRLFGVEDFIGSSLNDDWEKFLEEEGLELLAAYRNIKDKKTRNLLLELVKLASKEMA